MSYDIRFGVKVEGARDVYAVIGVPEYDSPTYNNRKIFETCMNWDYEQGKWYPMEQVMPKIKEGLCELTANEHYYKRFEPDNGWGGVESARKCLQSIYDWFYPKDEWDRQYDEDIPLNCIYMKW